MFTMPAAARLADTTNHGGEIIGFGEPHVLIGGMPVSVLGDAQVCAIPYPVHMVSAFPMGSITILIGSKPALRITDAAECGAMAVVGEPTEEIG
jgi:uncharacterized Zn-binding protein involved in type VI secretion